MEAWIEFARGPLFAFSLLIFLLGMGRHALLQAHALLAGKGRQLKQVRWSRTVLDSLSWAIPVRHLVRGTIFISATSFLFHVGAILVPLFAPGHILLWERFLGVALPSMGRAFTDFLSLTTGACCVLLLAYRVVIRRARNLSRPSDYVLLALVLLPFASGYLAAHPEYSPLPWNGMLLIHILSAEALLIAAPFTKLSHIVLFIFDRLSVVHWQFRPGAGERVAEALFGEEARV